LSRSRSGASHGRAARNGGRSGSGCDSGAENGDASGNFKFYKEERVALHPPAAAAVAVSGPFFQVLVIVVGERVGWSKPPHKKLRFFAGGSAIAGGRVGREAAGEARQDTRVREGESDSLGNFAEGRGAFAEPDSLVRRMPKPLDADFGGDSLFFRGELRYGASWRCLLLLREFRFQN
jgi:hypothetical protein